MAHLLYYSTTSKGGKSLTIRFLRGGNHAIYDVRYCAAEVGAREEPRTPRDHPEPAEPARVAPDHSKHPALNRPVARSTSKGGMRMKEMSYSPICFSPEEYLPQAARDLYGALRITPMYADGLPHCSFMHCSADSFSVKQGSRSCRFGRNQRSRSGTTPHQGHCRSWRGNIRR